MSKERFENKLLRFSDDPMFRRVMRDEEIAKGVAGTILGKKIDAVSYVNTEQEMAAGPYCRGIRLDAYVANSEAAYDIEMQTFWQAHLGKRFRFYQSVLDSKALAPREDFSELRSSVVAFICLHDPLKGGLPRYTFVPTCRESPASDLESDMQWLVFNSTAWSEEGRLDLRALLEYVQKGNSASLFNQLPLLDRIDRAVEEANADERWRFEMLSKKEEAMALRDASFDEGKAEGIAEGIAIGEARYHERQIALMEAMEAAGRAGEFVEALKDRGEIDRLMKEFDI